MAARAKRPERLRAIGYVRVSTVEQASEGVSLAAQRAAISAYSIMHRLDLGEIMEDAGESGGVPLAERPGGSRLVAMVRAGEVGAVVVAKLDRAWRSAADALARTSEWTDREVALHLIDMVFSPREGSLLRGSKVVFWACQPREGAWVRSTRTS